MSVCLFVVWAAVIWLWHSYRHTHSRFPRCAELGTAPTVRWRMFYWSDMFAIGSITGNKRRQRISGPFYLIMEPIWFILQSVWNISIEINISCDPMSCRLLCCVDFVIRSENRVKKNSNYRRTILIKSPAYS